MALTESRATTVRFLGTEENESELTQLIYFSKATGGFERHHLKEILATSRRNNSRSNITGLLLYHDGNILQILEGEKNAVQMLYTRIAMDVRHKGVMSIVSRPVTRRDFQSWSMGFKEMNDEDSNRLDGYSDLLNSVSTSPTPDSKMSLPVQRLIQSYKKDVDDKLEQCFVPGDDGYNTQRTDEQRDGSSSPSIDLSTPARARRSSPRIHREAARSEPESAKLLRSIYQITIEISAKLAAINVEIRRLEESQKRELGEELRQDVRLARKAAAAEKRLEKEIEKLQKRHVDGAVTAGVRQIAAAEKNAAFQAARAPRKAQKEGEKARKRSTPFKSSI